MILSKEGINFSAGEGNLEPASAQQAYMSGAKGSSRQVHTITDRFSIANTYILNDTRLIVVDPGSVLNVQLLLHYVQTILHRTVDEIDLIVVTHLHPDHTAGVKALRRLCMAPVAASAAVRAMVEVEEHEGKVLPTISHIAAQAVPAMLHHLDFFPLTYARQARQVDVWLEDAACLPQHPDWQVIASPGHTPESLCLYNAVTRELLCGDTVITMGGGAPLLRSGTNRRQLEETLQTLCNLNVQYLYPGHGRAILSYHPLDNAEVE